MNANDFQLSEQELQEEQFELLMRIHAMQYATAFEMCQQGAENNEDAQKKFEGIENNMRRFYTALADAVRSKRSGGETPAE
jgi:CHASE3 domain sensor protein